MKKNILFGKEARDKVKKGVNIIADAVAVTLGSNGRNVIISNSQVIDYGLYNFPVLVTKDGVTVARHIQLEDTTEDVGARMMKQASEKTMQQAGDGTTTTIVLARAIVNEGFALIEQGSNPMELKKGIDKAVEYVVEELKKQAIPIGDDFEKIKHIATVSANNDSSIGDLIAGAFEKIGKSGIIDIEESKSTLTEIKISDGFKFDKGWLIPSFITNPAKNECELIEPYILLYDKNISLIKNIAPILEKVVKERKPILIICDDMDGEALAYIAVNVAKKNISACVVKSPFFGNAKRELMEDLAAVTGATFISDIKGVGIENASLNHLGFAKKIVVSKDETIIINGDKNEHEFEELHNNLQMNLTQAKGDEEKEKIETRIARLTGSVAVISVGAPTETEMRERKDRVDDAIRAVKSAISEGFIIGGGAAFLRIKPKIKAVAINIDELPNDISGEDAIKIYNQTGFLFKDSHEIERKVTEGEMVIFSILKSPLSQICKNAGVDESEIISKVSNENGNMGYNAKTDKIENLIDAGIIDPVKVLRCCLQNAASVATMILTAECMVVDSLN
jgi:chaperonin GroEL